MKHIKQVIVIFILIITLNSCYKDIEGQCGVVMDHHITGSQQYPTYRLVVRFDNGLQRDVPVTFNDWFNFKRGEKVCF